MHVDLEYRYVHEGENTLTKEHALSFNVVSVKGQRSLASVGINNNSYVHFI